MVSFILPAGCMSGPFLGKKGESEYVTEVGLGNPMTKRATKALFIALVSCMGHGWPTCAVFEYSLQCLMNSSQHVRFLEFE